MSTFLEFATAVHAIAQTRGTKAKAQIATDYLRTIDDPKDLETVVTWMADGAFSQRSGRSAAVGAATIAQAACHMLEIDYEAVFRPSKTATGSSSETISRLMEYLPSGRAAREPRLWSILEVMRIFEDIAAAKGRIEKQEYLWAAWKAMTGLEIRYFLRVLSQGSLRIGFDARNVVAAVAEVFGQAHERVRSAWMLTGSAGEVARLCKEGRLDTAQFEIMRPLAFMLASPIEQKKIDDWSAYVAEDKYDGMRCQLHAHRQEVRLYSRDLNALDHSFPDLIGEMQARHLPSLVLDGEICVVTEGVIRPFQWLQKRMGAKKPGEVLLREYPVQFIAYDIIFHHEELLIQQPLSLRRERLVQVSEEFGIPYAGQVPVGGEADIDRYFDQAIGRGNEGLMLKRLDSLYEFGQRRSSWLKVKRPGGSLDTVILYATAGSGRRGGTFSDFTLAVRVADDDRFEQEWVPIGKAYGGYTNEELRQLNEAIRPLIVERFGPTVSLQPKIMVEIEFDAIQENKRTKAGYTLRFPRFKAIRWDKPITEANTLKDVEQYRVDPRGRP